MMLVKKIISILTICLMICSIVPMAIYAETAQSPAYIVSGEDYKNGSSYYLGDPARAFTISAPDGYTISRTVEGTYEAQISHYMTSDTLDKIFIKDENSSPAEVAFTDKLYWDQIAPGCKVTVGPLISSEFTEITMGDCDTFFTEPVTVTIEATDGNSGIQSIEYLISDTALGIEDLEDTDFLNSWNLEWKPYNSLNAPIINKVGTYIIYVKAEDNVGNVKYINSCLFAYGGALRYVNDQPNYIDYSGKTKTPVSGNEEILWIKEASGGQTTLFALDNSRDSFKADSIFHVRGIDPYVSSNEWDTYYNMFDDTYRDDVEKDHIYMFDIGVTDPDGNEITEFEPGTDLYVALPDGWDPDDVEAAYIKSGTDESLSETITNDEIVSRNGELYVKLSLNHFSTYVIYDTLSDTEKAAAYPATGPTNKDAEGSSNAPKTGDDTNTALWFIIACAALTACITIRRKA